MSPQNHSGRNSHPECVPTDLLNREQHRSHNGETYEEKQNGKGRQVLKKGLDVHTCLEQTPALAIKLETSPGGQAVARIRSYPSRHSHDSVRSLVVPQPHNWQWGISIESFSERAKRAVSQYSGTHYSGSQQTFTLPINAGWGDGAKGQRWEMTQQRRRESCATSRSRRLHGNSQIGPSARGSGFWSEPRNQGSSLALLVRLSSC